MSKEFCTSCSFCKSINKNYCDNCQGEFCQENMKNHREIFLLFNQFPSFVSNAEKELESEAKQIKNNFYNNFSVNINQSTCSLNHCEFFFNHMKTIYDEMIKHKNFLNNQIGQNKINFEKEKINLENDLNNKFNDIDDLYKRKKILIDNLKSKWNNDIDKDIVSRKKTKIILEEKKEKIKNININEIVNNYIEEKKSEMLNDYEYKKKQLDEQNKKEIENMEYTKEDKYLESYYLNIINNIKNYSKKIPYFDNWMKVYNLNKYIK